MMNMDTNVAMKLASAALTKGYGVWMFGYGEGVWLIKNGQEPNGSQTSGTRPRNWPRRDWRLRFAILVARRVVLTGARRSRVGSREASLTTLPGSWQRATG